MAERADAFVVLPGGFGTFEEMFEMVTWAQLRLHAKPVGLVNCVGYFDHLLASCGTPPPRSSSARNIATCCWLRPVRHYSSIGSCSRRRARSRENGDLSRA